MKHNNYNRIAWCYDILSYLVFGNAIKEAQTGILNFIAADADILIAGGGTGWILEEIAKIHPEGLFITYVDASEKMIEKSKQRIKGKNTIKFICQPVEQVNLNLQIYDVIITPFFFDNFPQKKCCQIFKQLHTALRKEGMWLFVDFEISSSQTYWQKPLLNFMYRFFKLFCKLEAGRLPDINDLFLCCKYEKIAEKKYYNNFIVSKVFKKKSA